MTRPAILLAVVAALATVPAARADRARGIDVSYWQGGNVNWSTVANSGIDFAFIRSSRGGTTGTYETSTTGTLSQRYDDPYTQRNVAGARANGILAGVYHFSRPDIATNTGLDEANHFLEHRQYMRPGHLRPVLDLEAGAQRSRAALTDWALEFSDRINAVIGVRPIVYINSSYANDQIDERLAGHDLWIARWDDQVDTQTAIDPPATSSYPNVYGRWNMAYPTLPDPRPWDFWQHSASGTVPGITANVVDLDVANGDVDFVREFLVPAIWMSDVSGEWTTAANWNGQVVLPTANDRTILSRSSTNVQVTLSSGTHAVRSLQADERLRVTGGSLAVAEYVRLNANATIAGGTLTSATIANAASYVQSGGTVTTGTVTGTGSVAITGGTLRAASIKQSFLSLDLDGVVELTGTTASVLTQLTAEGASRLDLGAAKLILNYPSVSPIDATRELLLAGRIVTTDAPGVAVGFVEATDLFTSFANATFGGEPVDPTSLLLTRALRGDTNLSGTVDFADLLAMAQAYGGSGDWIDGDSSYNGVVDFVDLLALAQNYGANLLSDGESVVGVSEAFDGDLVLARSLVPEPTLVATGLACLALLARRR